MKNNNKPSIEAPEKRTDFNQLANERAALLLQAVPAAQAAAEASLKNYAAKHRYEYGTNEAHANRAVPGQAMFGADLAQERSRVEPSYAPTLAELQDLVNSANPTAIGDFPTMHGGDNRMTPTDRFFNDTYQKV